jgi:hypothetical protein
MIGITLPPSHRRTALRSFWASIAVGTAICAALFAYALGWRVPLAWGIAGMVVVGSFAFTQEQLARRLYNAWNNRLVLPVSEWCARYVMRLCFFVVFVAAGRAGSAITSSPAAGVTGWEPRGPAGVSLALRGGWIRAYATWAVRSGNAWSLSLLPFLLLLRVLAVERDSAAAVNIYTLF